MDDAAASQQLINEDAHAASPNGNGVHLPPLHGADDVPSPSRKTRKNQFARKASRESPASSPFPFPPTQTQRHDDAVEVPDSQTVAATAPPTMSPPTSSLVVPSSVTKSKRTYAKSKQFRRFDAIRDIEPEQDVDMDGNTTMDAAESASPSHAPAQRKRPHASSTKPDDATNGVEGAGAETPTPAPHQATTVRDLLGLGNGEDDLDSSEPPATEKKKLKRVHKRTPRRPVAANIYEIPDDEPRTRSRDSPVAQEAGNRTVDTFAEKKDQDSPVRKERHGKKNGKEQEDETVTREPVSSDDEIPPDPPSEHKVSSIKKKKNKGNKKEKKVRGKIYTQEALLARRASGIHKRVRESTAQSTDVISAAENALNNVRELAHPPDLRRSGDFTRDEEELIRRAIRDYQQRKGLDTSELVDIIQWTRDDLDRSGDRPTSNSTAQETEEARENAEFWEEIKNLSVSRTSNTIRHHIRSRYHQYKSGGWTEDEDEQLRNLHALHPNKWKIISTSIGDRSMHDCQNRWREYLQYGDKRNVSTWSREEEELLIRTVNTLAQRDEDHRAESGQPPLEEYTSKNIHWPQVSREMGGIRSRLQACVKWKKLQQRNDAPRILVEYKPRNDKVRSSSPASAKKGNRRRPRKSENLDVEQPKKRRKTKMSQVVYQDSEHEMEDDNATNGPPVAHTDNAEESVHGQEEDNALTGEHNEHKVTPGEEQEVNAPEEVDGSVGSQLESSVQYEEENSDQYEVEIHAQEDQESDNRLEHEQNKAVDEDGSSSQAEEDNTAQKQEDDGDSQEQEDDYIREEVGDSVQDVVQDQKQNHVQAQAQEKDQPTVVTRILSPKMHPKSNGSKVVSRTTSTPGVDRMLWGDVNDLMLALSGRRDQYEDEIDWDDVAKSLTYPWSLQSLQSALQEMIQLLRDNDKEVDPDNLASVIDDILDFMLENHAEKLDDHYDPYQEIMPEGSAEMEDAPVGTPPSTERKKKKNKKRKSHDNEQLGSSPEKKRKKKKKHSKSTAATPDTPSS
jgi:hypothetical protein